MTDSLRNKTIKGVGWSALDNLLSYIVTFIVGIILARLLSPDDYGLIGLTGVFITVCGCFINAGFDKALIRKHGATEEDYNTVFIVNICTSLIFYGVIFVCSPFIADFFGRRELTALIRVVAIGMILSAPSIVPSTRLTKQLKFKIQTKITFVVGVVRGVLGIYTAFIGWGVWALVMQGLIGNALTTILLFYVDRWLPVFRFSKKSFFELFGFGSKLLVSTLIDTIWSQCYQIVIGKCYTPATLGQYARANSFSDIFSSNLTGVVQRVSYPVLSEIKDERQRLYECYRKIIKSTMFVTFCIMLMLAAVSRPLIIVFVGEKWLLAADFLQIICFSAMLYPLHSINLNILQVLGRSDLFLKLEVVKKLLLVIPIFLGIFVNIYWMLIGSAFSGLICYYINAYYSGEFLNYTIINQVHDILPSFFIAFASSFFAYLLFLFAYRFNWLYGWFDYLIILLLQLGLGLCVIITICEKLHLLEYEEIKCTIRDLYKKILY